MIIRPGWTCGGRDFDGTTECASGEIRFLSVSGHPHSDSLLDMASNNNIFAIVNMDLFRPHSNGSWYPTNRHWFPGEAEFKNFVRIIIVKGLDKGFTKKTMALALDNEPTKYFCSKFGKSWADYVQYARWVRDVLVEYNFPFDFGIGCDEGHKTDFFTYICENAAPYFQIIYYHLQASAMNRTTTASVLSFMNHLKVKYNKRLSCNEATWYDTMSNDGWNLLLYQLIEAEKIGTEDFCVFINNNGKPLSQKPEFMLKGIPRNKAKWLEWRRIMLEKKGKTMPEYNRPISLQAVYDAMGLETPYHVDTPSLYVVGKKDPDKALTWADQDAMIETQMKAFIKALKNSGALAADFPDYPNIKYDSQGNWIPDWQAFAKSNPKPQ